MQDVVEGEGFSVVRDFVGHGIGVHMHEDPQVPNFGEAGRGMKLKAGMVIAIEPMVNAGRPDVMVLDDGWTAVAKDGSMSAHFEHTVAVTAHRSKNSDRVAILGPKARQRASAARSGMLFVEGRRD